nr:hypothetical protein [Methylosinus sp. Sm6]
MSPVVQFDGCNGFQGAGIADDEIDALSEHLVHRRTPFRISHPKIDVDQLGEPHLREHAKALPDRLVQDAQEPFFIGREKSPTPIGRPTVDQADEREKRQKEDAERDQKGAIAARYPLDKIADPRAAIAVHRVSFRRAHCRACGNLSLSSQPASALDRT